MKGTFQLLAVVSQSLAQHVALPDRQITDYIAGTITAPMMDGCGFRGFAKI